MHDVSQLIQVGSPNQGAIKAYSVWQAGVFPKDWAVVGSLIRFYGKDIPDSPQKNHDVVHTYFSSVQDLQPTYPALKSGKKFRNPEDLTYANTRLLSLNQRLVELTKRVSVSTVVSQSETTPVWSLVQPVKNEGIWPDGEQLGDPEVRENAGDGTVIVESARLLGGDEIRVKGGHQNLPGTASQEIVERLLGIVKSQERPQPPFYSKVILFSIDCPVFVSIEGPNKTYTSTTDLYSPVTGEGSVLKTDDLQWFVLPELTQGQEYIVNVTALDDTPVRYWWDDHEIQTLQMKKGEVHQTIIKNFSPEVIDVENEAMSSQTGKGTLSLDEEPTIDQVEFTKRKFQEIKLLTLIHPIVRASADFTDKNSNQGDLVQPQKRTYSFLERQTTAVRKDLLSKVAAVLLFVSPLSFTSPNYFLQAILSCNLYPQKHHCGP